MNFDLRAIIVSVDYADYLSLTLPYNRHHFKEVYVVTAPRDTATIEIAQQNDAQVIQTDLFYENGAIFNKWAALEHGLDVMKRDGWICIMDADVCWPKTLNWVPTYLDALYTPRRRMFDLPTTVVPPEELWNQVRLHRNEEFAGWSQVFHASCRYLGPAPWHEIDWTHAGGADSFFQMKWPHEYKIRPPFECLHLGLAGKNWCGRVTPNVFTGEYAQDAEKHAQQLELLVGQRQLNRLNGLRGSLLFQHEKLKKDSE